MKYFSILIFSVLISLGMQAQTNFHSFKAKDIDGNEISMSKFAGKKVLVVNVASKCGYTKQYKDLQELYDTYGGKGFEIVAFPANNFLMQEPGSNGEIKEFCSKNYGVSFTMMSKISVKGEDMDPLYQWLTQKSKNSMFDAPVQWNFQKFLIDENGNLVDFCEPKELPTSSKIVSWIKN